MDSLKCLLFLTYFMCFWKLDTHLALAHTTTSVNPAGPTGQSRLDTLATQTANLATKLNEEIAKRELLEKEVQSKNDLTEFLRQDVQMLNKTLEQEISKRTNIEVTLSQVQGVINNVQSTLREDRDNVAKLSRDLRALDSRLTSDVSSLNRSLDRLHELIDSNKDRIQNVSLTTSGLEPSLDNQTMYIDLLFKLLGQQNKTTQQKLKEVSSEFRTVEMEMDSQEKTLNSTISMMNRFHIDLNNQGSSVNALMRDLSALNKSSEVLIKLSSTNDAALNVSIETMKHSLETLEKTLRTDVKDIQINVTNLERTIYQYDLMTKEYNKTIDDLSAQISKASKTGDSEVYFYASRPRTMLRLNQPPVFTSCKSNIGSTFDPQTSLFTTPIAGVYLFTVNLQKDTTETNQGVLCWLKKNGSLQMLIDAHSAFIGSSPSATNTIVLDLTKGDRIQLTQCTGPVFISSESSSFSGVLLHSH